MNKAAPRQTFCDRVVRVYARPQPDASHGRPENFNPHCHAIISGGVWTAEGEFLELPSLDTATVCELFRRLLLRQERLSERFIKNSMCLRVGRQMSYESAGETRLVSGAKLAPQGRLRKAQGASPGNKHSNKGSPEGAMQLVPVPKRLLMTSIYLELRTKSLRRPFRAFRNLALEPRACALGCPAGPLRGSWFRARN